jgi:hypothetical protein
MITAVEEAPENALRAENEQLKTELAKALQLMDGLSAKVDALLKATPAGPKPTATRTVGSPKASVQAPAEPGKKTINIFDYVAERNNTTREKIESAYRTKPKV